MDKASKVNKMQIRREELISIYEDMITSIWLKAKVMIGEVTIGSLMETAIHEASSKYHFMQEIEVLPRGINIDKFRGSCESESLQDIKAGFENLITNLFTIVASLTGDVILQALNPEIEKIKRKLKEEAT